MTCRVCSVAVAAVALVAAVAAPLGAQDAKALTNPLTDTSVYPIAVWAMGENTAPAYAEMGVNIFVGEGEDPLAWCDAIARSGCAGFVHWRDDMPEEKRKAIAASPGFLGWMHGDEPDNPATVDGEFRPTGIAPEVLIARYRRMKASSTPAPMYLNLGIGLAVGTSQSTPDAVYREFMNCADVVCYDVYPVSTHDNGANRLHLVARGMSRLKAFAGPDRPAWIWLECTRLSGDAGGIGHRAPLPHELRAEVWMSILHGADGIGYFPHQFNPGVHSDASIPEVLKKEITLTNRLLHKAAPILRTGTKRMLKVDAGSGRVDAAAWEADGELLVVAVNMRNEPATATIALPRDAAQLTVVGQNRRVRASKGSLPAEEFKPYEARLYYTGSALTYQHYGYPDPALAVEPPPSDVRIDFEGDLPAGAELKGAARVVEDQAHGGKKSLYVGEMGEVTLPLTEKDFRGRVTLWVYDSSKKHERSDPNTPASGTCWGLSDAKGRSMLFGIIRKPFLSQSSYSFVFPERLRGYPSPGFAGMPRTKAGWYKWEFDLSEAGRIKVLVNGKPTHDVTKDHYAEFDQGFNAITIVGGAKGEFEDIYIDDITVEYPEPREEDPGRLVDIAAARDNRKGVLWVRTQNTRLACPELPEAPTIDGDLSDKAWGAATPLLTWARSDGTTVATFQTIGRVGRHGGRLYLSFLCIDHFSEDLVIDKKAPWQNDCIEIFIDPDNRRTSHAHIVVTAGGRISATRTVQDSWGEGLRDDQWQPDIMATRGTAEDAWTVEVSVPLADLGSTEANPVWGFDVARERKPAKAENSVYTIGGFHQGACFAELSFKPADVTLANATLTNRSDKEATARVDVLISEREPGKTFPTWEAMWFDLAWETLRIRLAPGESVNLLTRDLKYKVPDGGRLRLTLLEDDKPVLFEEFIAHVWGGDEE